MPIAFEQGEALSSIRLEGRIDIALAAELKMVLIEALTWGRELRVDLERATELDMSALQLLWAAEREARGAGIRFTLAGSLPDEISVAAADAGFEAFPIPTNSE